MVGNIAKKWTEIMRTGAVGARFMGVDPNTVMFNMERGRDIEEVCLFVSLCYFSFCCLLFLNTKTTTKRRKRSFYYSLFVTIHKFFILMLLTQNY